MWESRVRIFNMQKFIPFEELKLLVSNKDLKAKYEIEKINIISLEI
jgi:hypothetical protein